MPFANKKVVRKCFDCKPVGKLRDDEMIVNTPCSKHKSPIAFKRVNGILVDSRFEAIFKRATQPPVVYGRII